MVNNIYPKGSEWRKWDLHIHTPLSHTSEYQGSTIEDKWKYFFDKLEQLPKDIKVIGINDYLFIEGYQKVLEYKKLGNLKNIDLILPVVEFRLKEFVGHTDLKRINYHIIFGDDSIISAEQIKAQFINKLNSSCNLDPNDPNAITRGGVVTPESIIDLGLRIYNATPEDKRSTKNYFEIGFNNINYELSKVAEALGEGGNPNTYLKDKYFKAIGKAERESFRWESCPGNKKTIINGTHFIFSASPTPEDAIKGKITLQAQGVNSRLLHCSDAHKSGSDDIDTQPKELGHCFTWIKGDPTFEGLKQVIYEPSERISIQKNLPQKKAGYDFISSIQINHEDIYNGELYIHPNLTTIIGGRSSGKSLLLALIAKKFTDVNPKSEKGYNTYISRLAENIKVIWGNGSENLQNIVDYFPQEAISELSRLEDTGEISIKLRKKIESILEKNNLYQIIEVFNKFCFENKINIESKISELFRVKNSIFEKEQSLKEYTSKQNILDEIKKINTHIQSLSALTKEQILNFKQIEKEKEDNDIQIKKLEEQKKGLNEYKIQKDVLNEIYRELDSKYEEILTKKATELNNYIKKSFNKVINDIEVSIQKDIEDILIKNSNLITKDEYVLGLKNIETNKQLTELDTKLKIEKRKLNEMETIENSIQSNRIEFKKLQEEIKELNKKYLSEAEKLIKGAPIQEKNKLKITPYVKCEKEQIESYLKEKINQKSDENKQRASIEGAKPVDLQNKILGLFDEIFIPNKLVLNGSFESKEEQFCKGLLSGNFINIDFSLTYDGIGFDQMSEGKRAFVILQLLLDFSEKTGPILIDQPEDDLDNRSISNYLAEYLKEKKKYRQIILVTHNANVVLGADAEMVIVANQHGEGTTNTNNKKFEYLQGSIENTYKDTKQSNQLHQMGIREHICDILEGGEEAFEQRKKKYNFIKN